MIHSIRLTTIVALCALATPAFAVCAGNQVPVFQCETGTKVIELCLTPDENRVTYRFGPEAAPEIELTRDFEEISFTPWSGFGRAIWSRVSVPNGAFAYEIYRSEDKMSEDASAGVEVVRGDREIASLACDGDGFYDLDTLQFALEDAGVCLDGSPAGSCE